MEVEEENWVGKSLEIKGREELIKGMRFMGSGKMMETRCCIRMRLNKDGHVEEV